jgi:hypothetical protein
MARNEINEENGYYQNFAHCKGNEECKQCKSCFRYRLYHLMPVIGVNRPSLLKPVITKGKCWMYVDNEDDSCRADNKELARRLIKEYLEIFSKLKFMGAKGMDNKIVKCDMCDCETETCRKIHGSGNNVVCVDAAKISEEDAEVYDRSLDNAKTIYSTIMSLTKHLGVESESELLATVALTMKFLVGAASNGDDKKYKAIMQHIGKAFCEFC